jgi:DNA-directed RNA polymerase subunit RPC12/RpoP
MEVTCPRCGLVAEVPGAALLVYGDETPLRCPDCGYRFLITEGESPCENPSN